MELGPNQKKWIAALRSGEYQQGIGLLKDEACDLYCCLGVAVALFGEGCPIDGASLDRYPDVQRALFLRDKLGRTHKGVSDEINSLASMNDEGSSFAEIADMIEKYPGAYFWGSK